MRRPGLMAVILAVVAGCSTQPTKPAQTAAAENDAPAKQSEVASAGAAPAASVPTVEKKVPSGYRRVKRDGRELYCRSVVTLGSRFPEEMCFTREQLEEIARRTDSTMDEMERNRKICVGAGCGGG